MDDQPSDLGPSPNTPNVEVSSTLTVPEAPDLSVFYPPIENSEAPVLDTNVASDYAITDRTETAMDVDLGHFYYVLLLAIASIVVAAFCLTPSIVEQKLARQFGLRAPDAWSYFVILLSVVQIALSIYAIRIPDWSTVWLLTICATSVAAIYAAGLALTMFASKDHVFVRQLGLLDEADRYRAQPWCFFVLCIALILAYSCGRFSVRWHQIEMQFAEAR